MAAAVRDGPNRWLVQRAKRRADVRLFTNEFGLNEAERSVQRFRPDVLDEFLALREGVGACADPTDQMLRTASAHLPQGVQLPGKDLPILAGAIIAAADWLVTRDNSDFGPLYGKRVLDVEVVRIGTALARLQRRKKGGF